MAKIKHLEYQSPLTSSNLSRPDRQLELAIRDLEDRVDSAEIGAGTFIRFQNTTPSVVVGTPVYWDKSLSAWAPGLAAFMTHSDGTLGPADSSVIGGIVWEKTTSTTATILTSGSADFAHTSLMDPTPMAEGLYYLSMTSHGAVTQEKPRIAIPVFHVLGTRILFTTSVPDANSHTHESISLACVPAGTHSDPGAGNPHTITSPNSGLQGWLPAGDASFGGLAPAGAKFGYNIGQDSELQAVFPPSTAEDVDLIWNRGDGGFHVRANDALGMAIVDANGIWWMSDDYGQVPWPADYDTSSPPADNSTTLNYCLTQSSVLSKVSAVTSLKSNSPLVEITQCKTGTEATTGDLVLDLDFSNAVDHVNLVTGAVYLKGIHPTTGMFLTGTGAEGIIAGNNTLVTSTVQRNLIPGDPASATVHQGIVTITADVDPGGRELPLSFVRFSDAQLNTIGPIAYLGFPSGQASSLTAQVMVPRGGIVTGAKVQFRIEFLATASGGFPTPTVIVRKVASATDTPAPIPSMDTPLTLTMPAGMGSVASNTYFEAMSTELDVAAGDTLFVTVARTSGDGYPGDVGILRIGAVLV